MFAPLLLESCAPPRFVKIIDKSPTDSRKVRRADLSADRGYTGISFWGSKEASKENVDFKRRRGDFSKAGVIRDWGTPDESQTKGGVEYLTFHPGKVYSGTAAPGPAILGFKSNELSYLEAWDLNSGFYGDKEVLVIP